MKKGTGPEGVPGSYHLHRESAGTHHPLRARQTGTETSLRVSFYVPGVLSLSRPSGPRVSVVTTTLRTKYWVLGNRVTTEDLEGGGRRGRTGDGLRKGFGSTGPQRESKYGGASSRDGEVGKDGRTGRQDTTNLRSPRGLKSPRAVRSALYRHGRLFLNRRTGPVTYIRSVHGRVQGPFGDR